MNRSQAILGISSVAVALLFNLPYALLANSYEYPDILRRPAGEALNLFAQGGASLILTWHAFALAALALVPLSLGLSLDGSHLRLMPRTAIAAAITGSLAGITQAIGLWRWVFVVPALARAHSNPAATPEVMRAAEQAFDILNAYGGVAIGEHLGQLLTTMFVVLLASMQWRSAARLTAGIGFFTAATIAVGTCEGLAIALGQSGEIFSIATIVGFAGLTLWLIMTGVNLLRTARVNPTSSHPQQPSVF